MRKRGNAGFEFDWFGIKFLQCLAVASVCAVSWKLNL